MKARRHIEREFGVPLSGEILEPARWTRTALKHLPPEGPLVWESVFGRRAPVVVDLGCGNGRYLITSAVWRPDHDHLGIDILPLVLRYATRRGNQRGLTNVRFAACDGQTLVQKYLGAAAVREIHCYHPQPYHDMRDASRRLLTPAFLAQVHRCLEPEGLFFLQTDNPGYWNYLLEVVPAFFEFTRQAGPWPDAPKGRTRREIIALRRGLPVFRGFGRKKASLSSDDALVLAATLPLPNFDAGPPDREGDALEQESGAGS
jgi:tRNA (guanine-N7-)-methyltransferase